MLISARGTKIAIDLDGTAPAQVLLVHGGPGAPADFSHVRGWLREWHIAAARYDQRGVHRSTCDDGRWGLAAHAEDLEAVRQAIGADRVVVFGHSFGGLVALAWAMTYPQRVQALLLSSPALVVGAEFQAQMREVRVAVRRGLTEQQWRRLGLASAKSLLPGRLGDQGMAEVYGLVLRAYTGSTPPAWVAHCTARATRKTRTAIMRESPSQWDFTGLPGHFPVHIAFGDRDIHGAGYATRAARVARAETTVLRDCGHVLWHDQPETFQSWLAKGLSAAGLSVSSALSSHPSRGNS